MASQSQLDSSVQNDGSLSQISHEEMVTLLIKLTILMTAYLITFAGSVFFYKQIIKNQKAHNNDLIQGKGSLVTEGNLNDLEMSSSGEEKLDV